MRMGQGMHRSVRRGEARQACILCVREARRNENENEARRGERERERERKMSVEDRGLHLAACAAFSRASFLVFETSLA